MKKTSDFKIIVRKRNRANGSQSLFLDITEPGGKRWQEYLGLFLEPENEAHASKKNQEIMKIAENARLEKMIQLIEESRKPQSSPDDVLFFDFFIDQMNQRHGTTLASWRNCLSQLKKYEKNHGIRLKDINRAWVMGYRNYLDTKAKQWDIDSRKREGDFSKLSDGTKCLMFQKFTSALNEALRLGLIDKNPAAGVKGFKGENKERNFLTIDELRKLSATPFTDELSCRAFLFSCLTGLRWSDIVNLKWGDLRLMDGKYRIVFTQKKTQQLEYLDISNQAVKILGTPGDDAINVFEGITGVAQARINISAWVNVAGINKHITFHCGRHTFAVNMLSAGVDIYTLSKLLGHKSIETTQIYAKILDKDKRAAVDKFPSLI